MNKKVLVMSILVALVFSIKADATEARQQTKEVIYMPKEAFIETSKPIIEEPNEVAPVKVEAAAVSLNRIRATCYLPTGNKTASGVYPYEGIIASNREHLGQVAELYTEDMEFIGYFECRDTGGHIGLKNGTRIDVYRENRARLKEWVNKYGDYVYIQWIDAK